MSKCDFNKVYLNHTSTWLFSCKFAAYFQNTFSLDLNSRISSVSERGDFHKYQAIDYFRKKLHLRYLTVFKIRL